MGKINAYDKIMIENYKKRENMEVKEIFLHKYQSNKCFRNGIHSLLKQADASWTADIIYRMRRISLLCRSGTLIDAKK